jgi:putative endonuclease
LATLQAAGLRLHTRNYRCPQGELDLVMQAADGTLVVVEVRYRHAGSHGGAAETVGSAKQHKLILATQHLLQARPELRRKPLRFDVVAVTGAQGPDAVEWIQDAFQT